MWEKSSKLRQIVEQAVREGEFVEFNNKIVDQRIALIPFSWQRKGRRSWRPRSHV